MKCSRILAGALIFAGMSLSSSAHAAIVYVDADFAGNTTLTNGSPATAVNVGSAGSGSDGLWRVRTNLAGNGATLYEANGDFTAGGNTENVPRLKTTITGLTAGKTYNVYTYFVGNHDLMRIGTSLSDSVGQLQVYTVGDALISGSGVTQVNDAALANFSNAVTNDNGFGADRFYQVVLGQALASASGTIAVYVDDDSTVDRSADGGTLRTVYEGVGHELTIPEPASLAMAGFVVLGLLAPRRLAR